MAMPTRCGKLELFLHFATDWECVRLFFHCLMSLHGFSWPFYCCFALSVHLSNYVADRNKSLCYLSSVATNFFRLFEQPRIFDGFAAIQPMLSFQRDIKPCKNNCNDFFSVCCLRSCNFTCKHECFTASTYKINTMSVLVAISKWLQSNSPKFQLTEWGIFTCMYEQNKIQLTFRQELFVLPFIADIFILLSIFV